MQVLTQTGFQFNRDWKTITNAEGCEIMRRAEGLNAASIGGVGSMVKGYMLTVDNLLKMISLQLRLRFHLPSVVMGETGAGKSI